MRMNEHGYVFNEWTPTRKARFVDWRMQGMHTHWAVFWVLINRRASRHGVYTAEEVKKYWASKEHPADLWRKPMGEATSYDTNCMPPQELFDALAAAEGDELKKDVGCQ